MNYEIDSISVANNSLLNKVEKIEQKMKIFSNQQTN